MDYKQIAKGDPANIPNRIHYIQAIIRNRLRDFGVYYPPTGAYPLLLEAWGQGVDIELLESLAKSVYVRTWSQFRDAVREACEDLNE